MPGSLFGGPGRPEYLLPGAAAGGRRSAFPEPNPWRVGSLHCATGSSGRSRSSALRRDPSVQFPRDRPSDRSLHAIILPRHAPDSESATGTTARMTASGPELSTHCPCSSIFIGLRYRRLIVRTGSVRVSTKLLACGSADSDILQPGGPNLGVGPGRLSRPRGGLVLRCCAHLAGGAAGWRMTLTGNARFRVQARH